MPVWLIDRPEKVAMPWTAVAVRVPTSEPLAGLFPKVNVTWPLKYVSIWASGSSAATVRPKPEPAATDTEG